MGTKTSFNYGRPARGRKSIQKSATRFSNKLVRTPTNGVTQLVTPTAQEMCRSTFTGAAQLQDPLYLGNLGAGSYVRLTLVEYGYKLREGGNITLNDQFIRVKCSNITAHTSRVLRINYSSDPATPGGDYKISRSGRADTKYRWDMDDFGQIAFDLENSDVGVFEYAEEYLLLEGFYVTA